MPENEVIQIKTDVDDYLGGSSCNLKKKVKRGGQTVGQELEHEVKTTLAAELEAQGELINNLPIWEDIYIGKKPPKTTPYVGANNYAVPMSRSFVKAALVRYIDVMFSQIRIWTVTTKPQEGDTLEDVERRKKIAMQMEMALDWWAKSIVDFKKKIFSPLLQAIKSGTGIVKMGFEKQKKTYVRYSTQEELDSPDVTNYVDGNKNKVVKIPVPHYSGPGMWPVSREDFVISSDDLNIQKSRFCGFRTYLTLNQIKTKLRAKFYDVDREFKDILEIVGGGDELDDVKKNRLENQGRFAEEVSSNRYEIWELWMAYDIDADGEDDDIVVTYHPSSGTIFRCIYNPFFYGFRPFVAIIPDPIEYSFDGFGAIQSLKDLQEALDKTFNQEMDRSDQINQLNLLIREGAGFPEDFKIYPGFTQEVDNPEDAIREVRFSDNFQSLAPRMMQINDMAEKVMMLGSQSFGQSTAERPVARETLAVIEESNKGQKYLVDNTRDGIKEIGWMLLELWAQHAPELQYQAMDDGGMYKTETLTFPLEYLRDGYNIDLKASSDMLNTEMRRQIAMTKYMMVKEYYEALTPLIQPLTDISGQVPMEYKKWVINLIERAEILLEDVLREFGDPTPEDLVLNVKEALNPDALVNKPPPPMDKPPPGSPPPPGQGPPPGPQQGPPGPM